MPALMFTKDVILEIAKNYKSYTEFKRREPNAYRACVRNKWLYLLKSKFPLEVPYTQMSDEALVGIAKQYSSRKSLAKAEPSVIAQMSNRGILDQLKIVFNYKTPKTEYSDEEIIAIAKKYKSVKEFRKHQKTLYMIALERRPKLWEKLFPMLESRVIYSDYTDKELIDFCKTIKSRKEIREKASGVEKLIYSRGLIDQAFGHFERVRHEEYSESEIIHEMEKYETQKEFELKNSKIYNAAKRRKILKGYYKKIQNIHSGISVGELTLKAFLEKIFKVEFEKTRKLIVFKGNNLELDGYSEELNIAFEHQGIQHIINEYRGKSTAHIKEKDKKKVSFCKKNGIKLIVIRDLVNYYNQNEIEIKNKIINEFNLLCIKIPDSFWNTKIELMFPQDNSWNYEKVLKRANLYTSFSDFKKNEKGAKNFLNRHKLTTKLLAEMKWIKNAPNWTYRKVLEIAKMYNSFKDFSKNEKKAYSFVLRTRGQFMLYNDLNWTPTFTPWSYESALNLAKKCASFQDFQNRYPNAVGYIYRFKLKSDILKAMNWFRVVKKNNK
jgi:hypothetical protein